MKISSNHLKISSNHLKISSNHLKISSNHLKISSNDLKISLNEFKNFSYDLKISSNNWIYVKTAFLIVVWTYIQMFKGIFNYLKISSYELKISSYEFQKETSTEMYVLHHFKSDKIYNIDHMRILGTEPSSVILSETENI